MDICPEDLDLCPVRELEYMCDCCMSLMKAPFYNLPVGKKESIDFCIRCAERPLQFHVLTMKQFLICAFCKKKSVCTQKVKLKNANIYLCSQCRVSQLQDSLQYISEHFVLLEDRNLFMDWSPVQLAFTPPEFERGAEKWFSLQSHIVKSPKRFGSVRAWYIFTEMFTLFDSFREEQIFFLFNRQDGRIGAAIIDQLCNVYLCDLFLSYEEFTAKTIDARRKIRQLAYTTFESECKKLKRMLLARDYHNILIHKFYFLLPGDLSLFLFVHNHLIKRQLETSAGKNTSHG